MLLEREREREWGARLRVVFMCLCVMHGETRGEHRMSFLTTLYCLETGPLAAEESPCFCWPDWPSDSSPTLEFQACMATYACCCMCVLEIQTRVLVLAQPAFLPTESSTAVHLIFYAND